MLLKEHETCNEDQTPTSQSQEPQFSSSQLENWRKHIEKEAEQDLLLLVKIDGTTDHSFVNKLRVLLEHFLTNQKSTDEEDQPGLKGNLDTGRSTFQDK